MSEERGKKLLKVVEALMPLLQDGTVKMLDVGPGSVHVGLSRTVFYVREEPVDFKQAVKRVLAELEMERHDRELRKRLMEPRQEEAGSEGR